MSVRDLRRGVGIAALTVAALCPGAWAQGGGARFSSQVSNLEQAVQRLSLEFANPLAVVRNFPMQKRLIDARVFFELGNYESAAVLLMDVLDTPAFRGNLEEGAARLLLGRCLLAVGNLNAARDELVAVSRGADQRLAEDARFYLIEMALSDDNDERLRAVLSRMGGSATSDRTRYGLGKAYLRLGDADTAILWLQAVAVQSAYFAPAQYYIGVAHTSMKRYPQALATFKPLTQLEPDKGEAQDDLIDRSWLAVGRLQVELGDVAAALTSYQNIGRYSPHYEVALYEMAWAYITDGRLDRALVTVDILLLTVEDEAINVDAHVLRGRLNVMQKDYDEALASYGAIIDRFAPIRNELERFTRDPRDIQRYFQWLLERKAGDERISAPLSQKTSLWVESTQSIGRVAAVFDRIAAERHDIVEAQSVGADLEQILAARNRVELFPTLRDGWSRALVQENRIVNLGSAMLDAQAASLKGRLAPADATELSDLLSWRKDLETRFRELPTTFEAYDRRQARVGSQYLDLERKHFIVEQNLAEVKRQLLALERYINDKQYADEGEKLPRELEAEIRREMSVEKDALQGLLGELEAVKRQIEVAARRVGTGDVAIEGEQNLKRTLLAAHAREAAFYQRAAARLGGSLAGDVQAFAALRDRLADALRRLSGVIVAIDDEVGSKTAELRGRVAREVGALAGYSSEVRQYDASGRDLALQMGEALFRRAQGRMDQVVLEADVGILDVVWQKKEQASREIASVNENRSQRLNQLQEDLESLQRGAGDDPTEKRPAGAEAIP